jgi:ubiquinone/menaquinone biosynthesis C-methylase UbiE
MALLSSLKKALPQPIRSSLKQAYFSVLDLSDSTARRQDMTPPRTLIFVGDGDYRATGVEFRGLFTKYAGLKPGDRVLDVGCGTGRMAAPLTAYLSKDGEYQGIDIVKKGVEWAQQNISPRYPNFHFHHVDIHNKSYNPAGIYRASEYRFPYEDKSFDFVFLTSVFTHMFPKDMENYLGEISRVLKTGGTCFITFFLMNNESEDLISRRLSTQKFLHEIGGCYTTTEDNPEDAIAFAEPYIRDMFGKLGLSILEPIHKGSWCGRKEFLSYQDIVIARKI